MQSVKFGLLITTFVVSVAVTAGAQGASLKPKRMLLQHIGLTPKTGLL